jgi:peptide/nickel transport system substrate-binding protein
VARHIRWQILLILLGVVLVGILLTYLAVNYTTVLRPGDGGTYVEGIAGSPHYLNPLLAHPGSVEHDICTLLFSGMTRLNARGEVEPDLADWEGPSPDGLTYTFSLRRNAYWHDGTRVTADDVIFTIGILQDLDFPGPPELGSSVWRTVTVQKLNNFTVRFTLSEAYAPFLDYTAFGILPAHLLEGVSAVDLPSASFNLHPIGSGPFQLEETEIEDGAITSMILKPSSGYYGPKPHLGRVQFRFYPSDQAVLTAYEEGHVDGIGHVPAAELSRASSFPSLNLFSAQTAEYGIVFLNLAREDLPFSQEPQVRQALMYALDRQQMIDEVLEGQAVVAHGPLIPSNWAYYEDTPRYEYDPKKAEALLDEAGWTIAAERYPVRRKGAETLMFTLLTSSEPERVKMAQSLAEQWEHIGVRVIVKTASPMEVRGALETRNFEAILIHMAMPGDPDPYPLWHQEQIKNGQNYAGFDHRRASEVIEQARIINDRETRKQLYKEFQLIFAEEMPSLMLYVPVYTYGVDERIHDVQIGPLVYPADRFLSISSWWIVPRRVFVSESELNHP